MTAAEKSPIQQQMQSTLDAQRKSYIAEGEVSAATRIDRIDRAISLLVDYETKIAQAIREDFGHRPEDFTRMVDVAGSIGPLKDAKKHLRNWMKPKRVKPMFPLGWIGASAKIIYQPLGVVGVISPWNFPVQLTFSPLAGIFAAGNRVMIKPSEFTPATSDLMKEMFSKAYDESEVATFVGGPDVGQAFSGLAFDHLLFTGATGVAKHILHAAADNLVPVTLELGGKSPVLVSESADIKQAAQRIMMGKTMNAGQICIAPDYVYVPEDKADEFVKEAQNSVTSMFPTLKDNDDYTSIVNLRHFDRIQGLLDDAKEKGATVIEMNPNNEDFSQQPAYKIPPTLVLDPTEDMSIMQEEIFGPVLPIKKYKTIDNAVDYVNDHDRPLALYYFGKDKVEEHNVLHRTTSGGVSVNDTIMHVSQEELPFGGVGPSGMGSYHGKNGFETFSHGKSVFTQTTRFDVAKLSGLLPPYGDGLKKTLKMQLKK